ncbi:ras-related protein Rab-7L1 [Nephila pilipes]|uniref:Ras-related protein Rab-7L1 n=1 Tax=Nephila pilipes TaxID=299642 RepID=A0A8X6PGY2_NEPPI|nr:ras-related protein Rab-7L1 [Nephila pilipes]
MMLPNEYRSPRTIVKSDTSEEDDQMTSNHFTPSRLNSSNPLHSSYMNENGICDLESSGVFVAGYTGPIHKWEHPGYQFLTESAQECNHRYSGKIMIFERKKICDWDPKKIASGDMRVLPEADWNQEEI